MQLAIFIYATPDQRSRAYRAMSVAQECLEAHDEVVVVFDGGGVEMLAEVMLPAHDFHGLFRQVAPSVAGACGACAESHGVADALREAGFELLRDHRGHAGMRSYLVAGWKVLTF